MGESRLEIMAIPLKTFKLYLGFTAICFAATIVNAIRVQNPIPPLEIRRCGYLRYKIPANTFTDEVDGDTRNLQLTLKNSTNAELSPNSWVAFDAANQTLYVVLNDKILKNAGVPSSHYFNLIAMTKRGETAFATVQLVLSEAWRNTSVAFLINFLWIKEYKPQLAIIQSLFADKFMAYLGENVGLIRFTHIMQGGVGYSTGITNCTIASDKCDHEGIKQIQNKLYTELGTVPALRNAMQPEFYLSYIQMTLSAVCKPPEGPRVLKPFPSITLNPCTRIDYPIPYDIFYDEVDGYNLQLEIYMIDGKRVKEDTRWLNINGAEHKLYGVVTDRAIKEQPRNGYNVTVVAYDSHFLWAETFFSLKIAEQPLQKYYQFTLHLSLIGNSFMSPHVEQHTIVYMLNSFFKANFTNIMSYNITSSKDLSVRSSICTLPMKCDNASFTSIWNKMVTPASTPRQDFSKWFASRFILKAVTKQIDPICLQALEPPVPAINPWIVPITKCGGFKIQVPADLFYDKQDGNLRRLHLELFTHDEKKIPTSSWLQLNSTSQILYGLPTHEDVEDYQISAHQYYKLIATDKSGLNGSLHLKFSIQPAHPTTYEYQIVYSQSSYSNYLVEMVDFRDKLTKYLGFTGHSSVGLEKFTSLSSTTRRVYYRNCSSLFDPCDTEKTNQINSRLFVPSLNAEFKKAMGPDFNIILMSVKNTTNCYANTPPRVLRAISVIWISVCGARKFSIPNASFYDKEDGTTRNLKLSLTDRNNNSLSRDSWLYWEAEKQMITFTASVSNARNEERASFILTATDTGGLSTQMNLYTSISGPLNVLSDCKIQTKFQIGQSLTSQSNSFLTDRILSSMMTYFGLDSTAKIGLVSVERESSSVITVSWSYCAHSYKHYTQSSTVFQTIRNFPDFQGLSYVLRKVFVPGTFHVNTAFKSAFSGFTVLSAVKIFSGVCSSFPPVIGLNLSRLTINVSDCGVTKIPVGKDWFYDLEDGDAHQLNLQFLNHLHGEITAIESWVGFEKVSKTILIAIADKERKSGLKSADFYLRATDSTGKFTELSLTINIMKTVTTSPPFHITFYFVNKVREDYLNDTTFVADRIAEVYSLSSSAEVMIHSFHEDKGYVESGIFVWSSCKQKTCSSPVLQKAREQQGSEAAFSTMKQKFLPRLELQRFDLSHICGGTNTPPEKQVTSINIKVTMCGVSVYKIPLSTFSDPIDGNTRNMQINLLNNQRQNVSASSWIQLNAATLQVYAIPSLISNLHLQTALFYLQAVNSRSLSTELQVNVDVSEQPYTNDCPIFIIIKRKFGTDHMVDLSVLNKLLGVISSYYGDNGIKIKVLNFQKLSTYWYSLKYSNCSFTFATKEAASKGYDKSFRSTINEVFYRLITPEGTIQATFSSFMSKLFEVTSVRISYECIEAPPYPTVALVHRTYAMTCREFRDMHSKMMFNDARDGTNLKYSVTYPSGRSLSANEWIAFDEKRMEIYGMVTEEVKRNAPFLGYHYLIVATDSSGRSANITYLIKIITALPYMPIRVTIAYNSSFSDKMPTAQVLVNISRKIAGYLDGASRANEIMINSMNAGKSITFSHCKLSCTETDYMKMATKFQRLTYSSDASSNFKIATQGSFSPARVYLDGQQCLPSTSITTIVRKVVIINWQNVCGFIEYKVPDDVFTDNSGRKTRDFTLGMFQYGKSISTLVTPFIFDKAYQLFYGPVVASEMSRKIIYDLQAKHPQSGLTGWTSFTLNVLDYDTFTLASKSLCIVSATVISSINPAYSDAHVIKKFMESIAKYMRWMSQEIQIISYIRQQQNPIKFVASFANCQWYNWIRANSSAEMISKYTKSRDDTMQAMFVNIQQNTAYNTSFSSALSPDFSLVSLSVNDWCKRPPNKPPVANLTIITITTRPCTGFFRQVPENAFSDEDGTARSLKLQMFRQDGSALTASDWIAFNAATQSIYGSPTKQAHEANGGVHNYTITATDQYGLSTKVTVSIKISGSAPGNEPPTINMNNFKITLPGCGIHRAALPENFATDKEDGSMKNLHVDIRMMDGSKVPRDSWIQFDHNTYEIYSLVPQQISSGTAAEWQYRAVVTDSCGGEATTTIRIVTKQSNAFNYFHVFKFESKLSNTLSYLDIQIKFLELVSKYFKMVSNNFKTLSFKKLTGTEIYEYAFANCTTSRYICPVVNSHYLATQGIFTESVKNMNSFATYLSTSFRITSYQNKTTYHVDKPPRNISSISTDIEVKTCGSYYHDVSKYFSDRDSLRYEVSLEDGSAVPSSYPMYLASNILQIIPLGSGSSGTYTVRVTAYDTCNQSSYKNIKIRINNAPTPTGYQIRLQSEIDAKISTVYYVSQFKVALQSYLKNQNYGIEIESYSRAQNKLSFAWKSCYEVKEKCNKTDIAYLHSHLFTASNLTNPAFLARLKGTFTNAKLIEYLHYCNLTSYEPPNSNGSLDIVVDLCRKFEFRIPVTAFNDKEDGNTRNLRLSFFTENNLQLPYEHWLQFNRVTQTIYGYPRFSSSLAFQRSYKYSLVASDIQGNTASTSVTARIQGNTEITYRLQMHGVIKTDHHGPNIDCEILLIRKIGTFFNDQYINDISFERNGNAFVFAWSFCRMSTSKCDCFYIRHVESLLAKINDFKLAMNPEFELMNVTSTRYGVCIHPNAPQVLMDTKELNVYGGQTFRYWVHDRHFYDLEDGYTKNLTLYIAENNNKAVSTSYWIKTNKQYICGLATLSEIRSSKWTSSSSRSYKLIASDACGKEAYDSFSVVMNSYRASLAYKINVYVTDTYENVRSNCTKMQRFMYLVSSYVNASYYDIFIEKIYTNVTIANETSIYANYTVIVWGLRNFTEKNCRNETIRSYRERFTYENGSVSSSFYSYMKSDFTVVKVDDNTTACGNGTFLPIVVPPKKSDFEFPFWILILLLILAILFLLCWLCWLCIPRFCAGCCTGCIYKYCGCCSALCGKCCTPGGKYASLDEAALAPDVESGVLSNARTVPEPSSEKFGTEAVPDDAESAAAAEESPAPSKIDEDEMKMDQDAAPMLYAAPDYAADKEALDNDLDDSYENAAAAAAAPLPDDVSGGVAAMPREEASSPDDVTGGVAAMPREEASSPDDVTGGVAAMPREEASSPDDVTGGVAAMPHELPQDTETSAYSQSEGYSSTTSFKDEIDDGALAAPFSSDLQEYQQSSFSESSYSRHEEELELPQTMATLPAAPESAMAPALGAGPTTGKKLSLPQMPNVFAEHDLMSQAADDRRSSVVTESRNVSERRVSTASVQNATEGRRASITRPVRLIIPRHSVTSLGDVNLHDMNSDVISNRRSERRTSSQLVLLDHEELGNGSNNNGRRSSQSRRESQVFLRQGGGSNGQERRVSRVRLSSSEGSFADDEPIKLKIMSHNSSQNMREIDNGESRLMSKSLSVVSNGGHGYSNGIGASTGGSDRRRRESSVSFSSIRNQDLDDVDYQPGRRISKTRKVSVPLRHNYSSEFGSYDHDRNASTARRMSLSARRASASQTPFTLYEENNNDYNLFSKNSRSDLMGYESDSTDSGYAITRGSKRYRKKGDGGYGNGHVQMRRKSVTRRISTGGAQGQGSQGGSFEMWSRGQPRGAINTGYDSDSFV